MKQSTRISTAKHTLTIIEQGYYLNSNNQRVVIDGLQSAALAGTTLYTPDALQEMLDSFVVQSPGDTQYEVINETTMQAVTRLVAACAGDVLALNFASARNPGGGFLGGAEAQEESIARICGLYPCLLKAKAYYDYHRAHSTCLYSDHMIYSPQVPVFKNDDGEPLERPHTVSIITSPAVNAGVVRRNEPDNIARIIPTMQLRIAKMLALCAHHKHSTLVLGAWGCGVFQNDPAEMAQLFADALQGPFAGQFRHIVFAVKTRHDSMIEPFRQRLG